MKAEDGRYKDIILVIDISSSMEGEKLDKVKQDALELTEYILSDSNNGMALIVFDTSSEIKTGFINDKNNMMHLINNLTTNGCTNYNSALQNVDIIMDNYTQKDNTDLVTLFLTDGYPNEETPNEVAQYYLLKDKYPYMTINGIQYEMGNAIIQSIINISDSQWIADVNTLHNVLFDASISPIKYDNFLITDYINDESFYINSIDDIKVSIGKVKLELEDETQKITWDLGNNYKSGKSIRMTIDLDLKEEYHNKKGYYPTNKRENVVSKLHNEEEITINSELTPILKNVHNVIYDMNEPDGCNLERYNDEEYYIFEKVNKRTDDLFCDGYLFKGWEVNNNDKSDMTIINDDSFIMPDHDVHINAIWTKHDLIKSMNGTVYEKKTLYQTIQKEVDNGYAKLYTGTHQDSYNNSGTRDIYYFYANTQSDSNIIQNEKNNVIFANHCWKIYRTTDTGGVKIIYNGEPENDECLSSRGSHIGYTKSKVFNLSGTYYYGTDYTYDKTNKVFSLAGTIDSIELTMNNASTVVPSLIGKYTCKLATIDGTCSTLYLIAKENSSSPFVISLTSNSNYSQFGVIDYNYHSNSPAYEGYMYNDSNRISYESLSKTSFIQDSSLTMNTSWYYSNSIDYGNISTGKYTLISPSRISSLSNKQKLVGKYILPDGSNTSNSNVYYILKVNGTTLYYKKLSNGNLNVSMVMGDSYQKNDDGTYTITNKNGNAPTILKYETWYNSSTSTISSSYHKKYVCDGASDTCSEIRHIVSTTPRINEYDYYHPNKTYLYSEEISHSTDSYTLTGDIKEIWDIIGESEILELNSHHYTCFSNQTTCSYGKFILWIGSGSLNYIYLNDFDNIESALINMLSIYTDNKTVNKNNSTIKVAIDAWYKKYIYNEFDDYIEDTIYCNDRSIKDFGAWHESGILGSILKFKEYGITRDLLCTNETDRFSTLNDKAKLTYKVGLATSPEIHLLDNTSIMKTGQDYWLMSPDYFEESPSMRYVGRSYGSVAGASSVSNAYGLRPVISLKPGIEYTDGDGSMEHPYLIDDGTH